MVYDDVQLFNFKADDYDVLSISGLYDLEDWVRPREAIFALSERKKERSVTECWGVAKCNASDKVVKSERRKVTSS